MSDRLALTNAFEAGGMDRDKAEHAATVIVDMIRENVATKADLQATESRLNARIDLQAHQLLTRLGSLVVVGLGALFAAIRIWPPHG